MERRFYQSSKTSLSVACARLAQKATHQGQSLEIIASQKERQSEISEAIWQEHEFLPHSFEKPDGHSLITITSAPSALVETCFLIDDEDIEPHNLKLICHLFHASDQDIVRKRREDWKKWKSEGVFLTYWAENENGQWKKQAEENNPSPEA